MNTLGRKFKTTAKKIGNGVKTFIKNDDGFEFLQLVVVIAITAVLAGVIWGIATDAEGKLGDAQEELNKIQIGKPGI